jgi:hypothetical protein
MWRCTLKRENGTVIRTWEIESARFYLRLSNMDCGTVMRAGIPAEACDEILNALGVAT